MHVQTNSGGHKRLYWAVSSLIQADEELQSLPHGSEEAAKQEWGPLYAAIILWSLLEANGNADKRPHDQEPGVGLQPAVGPSAAKNPEQHSGD